jgi:nucleotide-binding universal stress UspA family protein
VLVVRPPYRGIRRVLVVTDGSEYSRRAVDYLTPPCLDESTAHRKRIHGRQDQPPVHASEVHTRCSWLPDNVNVTVMHILPPAISEDFASSAWTLGPEVLYPAPLTPVDVKALQAEEEKRGAAVLDEARLAFESSGLLVRTLMHRGDAATEILDLARQEQIDMIVCGSRGLNPVSGWLLGSVSRKLVHYAPCSVLIIK